MRKHALRLLRPIPMLVTAALVLGSGPFVRSLTAADVTPMKHLVWDPIDMVWRCIGSPVDCRF